MEVSKAGKKKYLDERWTELTFSSPVMPFFHSCDGFTFEEILSAGELKPMRCKVMNELLLYLFYGRPAYKNSSQESSKLMSFMPVSFILKSEAVKLIARAASLDTGAFEANLFGRHLHPGMNVDQFLLTPEVPAITRTVGYFYQDNNHYFAGKPKDGLKFDGLEFILESYYQIISDKSISKADDRKTTIEIQLNEAVVLSLDTIEAVIMPEDFAHSELVEEIVRKKLQAEVITYESFCVPSNNYYTEILRLTSDYLKRKNYLNV